MAVLDPQPSDSAVTDSQRYIAPDWYRWFYQIYTILLNAAQRVAPALTLEGQSAAIGLSTLPLPALANGTYRVDWYIRVTVPDGAGSSVALTVGFTESAIAFTEAFPAITGDTITAFGNGTMFVVLDQNAAITYQTAYSSTTPNKMQYRLTLVVEQV